jgi:hypothetical protein
MLTYSRRSFFPSDGEETYDYVFFRPERGMIPVGWYKISKMDEELFGVAAKTT